METRSQKNFVAMGNKCITKVSQIQFNIQSCAILVNNIDLLIPDVDNGRYGTQMNIVYYLKITI